MKHLKKIVKPHKNTPKQLEKVWKKNGKNFYKTAKELEINVGHVYGLIVKGVEPKRLDLKRKLFLTKKKLPEELELIRKKKQAEKEEVSKQIENHFLEVMNVIK